MQILITAGQHGSMIILQGANNILILNGTPQGTI